jgi:hypothetical protein
MESIRPNSPGFAEALDAPPRAMHGVDGFLGLVRVWPRRLLSRGGQVGFGRTICVRPNLTQPLGVVRCAASTLGRFVMFSQVGLQVNSVISVTWWAHGSKAHSTQPSDRTDIKPRHRMCLKYVSLHVCESERN